MKKILILIPIITLASCNNPEPHFISGNYYVSGDKNCKKGFVDSDGLLNCHDKNNVFIEKRTPMTPQQMQMYQAQQQANMQQINQINQQSQMNRPVFCNNIGTMTMCQ